jgi:hypothetical protein
LLILALDLFIAKPLSWQPMADDAKEIAKSIVRSRAGRKGARSRSKQLSPERRRAIAKAAARARWSKKKKKER